MDLQVEILGELTEADVALLGTAPRPQSSLKRVTGRHQAMARALASGAMNDADVATLFSMPMLMFG